MSCLFYMVISLLCRTRPRIDQQLPAWPVVVARRRFLASLSPCSFLTPFLPEITPSTPADIVGPGPRPDLWFSFSPLSLSFLQEGIAHIAVSLQGLGQVVRRIVGPGPQFHGDRAVNPLIEILTRDSRQHPFFPPDVVFMLSLSSSVVKLDTPHSRKSRRVYS